VGNSNVYWRLGFRMKVIYKYTLSDNPTEIEMHKSSRILSVQNQDSTLQIWALVETVSPLIKRKFRVFATGEEIVSTDKLEYIGTCLVFNGILVWHVFEVKK
jgi:hypothetical protein